MQQTNLPQISTFTEGGYFGGVISMNGTHKGVIWAPKQPVQVKAILLPDGKTIDGAFSPNDCAANMQALLAAGSPAAQQVAALNINGFSDWLIPSRDVLELGYRHFKPGTHQNWCSWRDGENANSVPPGWPYSPESPAQTNNALFQVGGEEAFDENWHWSSTVLPGSDTAFLQHFLDGLQSYADLSSECRVRAVSEIPL
jgi:hypothetical protein